MSDKKVIKFILPPKGIIGVEEAAPDPLFTARGEQAATLFKLQKVTMTQSFVARELEMPDIADLLALVSESLSEARDGVVNKMIGIESIVERVPHMADETIEEAAMRLGDPDAD